MFGSIELTPQARKKLYASTMALAATYAPAGTITMTPALNAALIKLRDADADFQAKVMKTVHISRTVAQRKASHDSRVAGMARQDALIALCDILSARSAGRAA